MIGAEKIRKLPIFTQDCDTKDDASAHHNMDGGGDMEDTVDTTDSDGNNEKLMNDNAPLGRKFCSKKRLRQHRPSSD